MFKKDVQYALVRVEMVKAPGGGQWAWGPIEKKVDRSELTAYSYAYFAQP